MHGLLLYYPKRMDFVHEYDEDVDTLIDDINFVYYSDDHEEDIRYKDEVIELFNTKLSDRIKKKNFVIERGILDFKRGPGRGVIPNKTKEEREIANALKMFARFNTQEDHDKLVNGIIKERQIRETIDQLKKFYSKGLGSLDQVARFLELHKKNQNALSQGNPSPFL